MRVVFRADDVGYTDVSNLGAFKCIDEGVVSLVELMPDTPGAIKAMEFLRERPWVSVNWHAHFWGNPVAGAENVPSLVAENGRFKTDPKIHRAITTDWVYEEVVTECRAQIERFIQVLGRIPDATDVGPGIIGQAKKEICDEYGIIYNYSQYWHVGTPEGGRHLPGHAPGPNVNPNLNPKYAGLKIYEYENFGRPGMLFPDYFAYDPMEMIKTMPESDNIWVRSQHPGYVDDYIWTDTWDNCGITRLKDVEVLCSRELRQWIKDNNVEVISLHDALFGTNYYQEHLAEIGSDLCVNGK